MVNHYSENKIGGIFDTNLNGVSVTTTGNAIEVRDFRNVSVFVKAVVSGVLTSAATVNIEASPTGAFTGEQVTLDSKLYVSGAGAVTSTTTDLFPYSSHIPFIRTTATLSSANVTTVIVGGR
jgi:hypothetical protein